MHIIHNYIPENGKPVIQKMKAKNVIGDDNESALFDIQVQNVTEGMLPCYAKTLRELLYDNSLTIVKFIMSLNTEINPSSNYRRDIIRMLCLLSKFYDNDKTPESVDPMHKWIGTYNLFRSLLIRFFKWLYSPEIDYDKRSFSFGKYTTTEEKGEINLQYYSTLRENYEYNLRYEEASEFFKREMELRRKYKEVTGEDGLNIKKNDRLHRYFSLTGLYYIVSLYGESLLRPTIFLSCIFLDMANNK